MACKEIYMYTDRNKPDGGTDERSQKAERPNGIRGSQEEVHHHTDSDSLGNSGGHGYPGWTIPQRLSGEVRAWLDSLRSKDPTRGGIASRLLEAKLEQLGEVRGRYEIVLKRKIEYEAKMAQLEKELQEIQSIAAEILQIDKSEDQE
jgi:hypothetical protein